MPGTREGSESDSAPCRREAFSAEALPELSAHHPVPLPARRLRDVVDSLPGNRLREWLFVECGQPIFIGGRPVSNPRFPRETVACEELPGQARAPPHSVTTQPFGLGLRMSTTGCLRAARSAF